MSETRPNGAEWTWTYLPDGLPETATNPEGHVTEYVYDDAGQLISTRFYESAVELASLSPAKTVTFGYNLLGQLTDWDDGTYSATYGYNLAGELVTTTVDYGPFTKSHSYTYDEAGRKRTYTNPEGITYTYSYDRAGNFISLDIPGEGAITVNGYTWYAPNRRTYPGGITMDDVYDPLLRLVGREVRDAGGNLITSTVNEYNVENQLTDLSRDGFSTQYLYDGLDRLIEDTGNGERFTYDGVGNRLTEAGDPATWTYGANHELLATGTASYTYTAAGHRETKVEGGETWTYSYDLEERLVRIHSDDAGEIGRYDYSPTGMRLSKTTADGTQFFHYDETGLIAEYDASGLRLAEYHYRPGGLWMTAPLFFRSLSGELNYYVNDDLGSPRRVFTGAGRIAWAASASPFGGGQPVSEGIDSPLRLPGQYFDEESQHSYNSFRYYDPGVGRYLEADPIGLFGGVNLYVYSKSNPIGNIDPLGLRCVAKDGLVECDVPGGPIIAFPRPEGWPDILEPGTDNYHYYNKFDKIPDDVDIECLEEHLRNYPTPGSPSPATPDGTRNNATPFNIPYPSPVISYLLEYNGVQVVVSVTLPGHDLAPGYMARVIDGGQINNFWRGARGLAGPGLHCGPNKQHMVSPG